jgi:nucleoside-diphosphate-sugar epimerase
VNSSLAVAVTGPDRWLRPILARRLTEAGFTVRQLASGAATVRGFDALVHAPLMMPGGDPARDVGANHARMTFAAAADGKVSRVVVISRVGPDKANDPYLDALRGVEASAVQMCPKVTIVRAAHPIGAPDSPGPVVNALRTVPRVVLQGDALVQPVAIDDLLDVVEAAVEGRLGAGVVEIGGPARLPLSSLYDLLGTPAGSGAAPRPGLLGVLGSVPTRRKRAREAGRAFLALASVPATKLASPLGAPTRDVVAVSSRPPLVT